VIGGPAELSTAVSVRAGRPGWSNPAGGCAIHLGQPTPQTPRLFGRSGETLLFPLRFRAVAVFRFPMNPPRIRNTICRRVPRLRLRPEGGGRAAVHDQRCIDEFLGFQTEARRRRDRLLFPHQRRRVLCQMFEATAGRVESNPVQPDIVVTGVIPDGRDVLLSSSSARPSSPASPDRASASQNSASAGHLALIVSPLADRENGGESGEFSKPGTDVPE
jgi:hypothetical protein